MFSWWCFSQNIILDVVSAEPGTFLVLKEAFLPFEEVYLYALYPRDCKDLSHPQLTWTSNLWLSFLAKVNLKMRTVTSRCFSFACFCGHGGKNPSREEEIQVLALSAILTLWFRHRDFFFLFWSSWSSFKMGAWSQALWQSLLRSLDESVIAKGPLCKNIWLFCSIGFSLKLISCCLPNQF